MNTESAFTVVRPGILTTFQDLGRRDGERQGVPSGGAADQLSAAAANILVGNPRDAALLEALAGGLALRAEAPLLVAVTGATATIKVDGGQVREGEAVHLAAGSVLDVGRATAGMRCYVAVNGELDAPRFMGSAAPEARMGFPQNLHSGQQVKVHSAYHGMSHPFGQPLFRLPVPRPDLSPRIWTVHIVEGPEAHAVEGIHELLAGSEYTVGPNSNHVGLRLAGPVRHPEGLGEIVSHGVPVGAFEIPHGDELIVLGRYRTLTAGYPIVAFAAAADLPLLGQAEPGRRLAFRWISRKQSVERLRAQECELRLLEQRSRIALESLGVPIDATAT